MYSTTRVRKVASRASVGARRYSTVASIRRAAKKPRSATAKAYVKPCRALVRKKQPYTYVYSLKPGGVAATSVGLIPKRGYVHVVTVNNDGFVKQTVQPMSRPALTSRWIMRNNLGRTVFHFGNEKDVAKMELFKGRVDALATLAMQRGGGTN